MNHPLSLNVPYYSQLDNRVDPYRTCNSSSHCMAANFLNPGLFASDCEYIGILYSHYGDTIYHHNHTNLLADRGVKSEYRFNLDYEDLDQQLELGLPIPIGVLHRGHFMSPTGGHIIVVIGKCDRDIYLVHDPLGHSFEYDGRSGKAVPVPKSSLDRRWLVDGHHSGHGRIFSSQKEF